MWKIIGIVFFILSLPVILIFIIASLFVFGKAKQCPPPTQVSTNATQLKLQSLEKTGAATISSSELTYALQNNLQDKVKDIRVCFDNQKINASGSVVLKNISPTFYLSTEVVNQPKLKLQNTEVTIGASSFIPGMSKLLGSIAQSAINDKLNQMPTQNSYTIKIQDNNLEITSEKPKVKK